MLTLITSILGLLSPLLKLGIGWLVNSGKVSDDAKKRLIEADKILSEINFSDIRRAKELEKALPEMDREMDEIDAGKKPFPWNDPENDESLPKKQ